MDDVARGDRDEAGLEYCGETAAGEGRGAQARGEGDIRWNEGLRPKERRPNEQRGDDEQEPEPA